MFYVLSKALDLLVAPLTWVLLLTLAGAWGTYRKRPRLALRAPLAAVVVLYAFSTPLVANSLAGWLEASATTTMSASQTYDVVVVLGGVADDSVTGPNGAPEFNDAVDRFLAAFDLARRERARYVLITSSNLEAHALARQLADWGIEPGRIVIEDRSRNTRDNAVESTRIVRERGWSRVLLVTSAMHMQRAEGCFRAAGLAVDTLTVDRRVRSPGGVAAYLAPRAESLALSTVAIREAVGRLVYRVVGYSA